MKPSPLVHALDVSHFGGKAASLARSLRAGLPVPHGFALGTTHVEAVFNGHAEALKHLRVEFTELAGPCAVRSSAVGEDSDGASFAGQHVTILNVCHEDHVVDAVLKVRESAHTESARAYRRTLSMDEAPRVGVVVQRMIEPDCAGVMFTRNPLNGSDERVIEASWGLGESVVAGLVVPDNYVLGDEGRVLKRTAGEKDIALRGAPEGGTVEEAVADELITALCLDDEMLANLHDLAVRCESFFGHGLDIEWAFTDGTLYLLQCRAMTRNR
ncbi:MAG: PEP/pyruvate-binding domain-containing protein [Vicinamibacterales bacterium]